MEEVNSILKEVFLGCCDEEEVENRTAELVDMIFSSADDRIYELEITK